MLPTFIGIMHPMITANYFTEYCYINWVNMVQKYQLLNSEQRVYQHFVAHLLLMRNALKFLIIHLNLKVLMSTPLGRVGLPSWSGPQLDFIPKPVSSERTNNDKQFFITIVIGHVVENYFVRLLIPHSTHKKIHLARFHDPTINEKKVRLLNTFKKLVCKNLIFHSEEKGLVKIVATTDLIQVGWIYSPILYKVLFLIKSKCLQGNYRVHNKHPDNRPNVLSKSNDPFI